MQGQLNMFDNIILEQEQIDLLIELVEILRSLPRLWCINPKGSYNRRNDFLLRLMVRKPGSYQAFPNGSCY